MRIISFNYLTDFVLEFEKSYKDWIYDVVKKENFEIAEINYIFCDDEYLHKLNVEFLNHDTLTDIISFDNTIGNLLITHLVFQKGIWNYFYQVQYDLIESPYLKIKK